MSIYIENYTEKSIVIRGPTIPIKDNIKAFGGKYGYYAEKPGWMFPKTMEAEVRNKFNIRGDGVSSTRTEAKHDSPPPRADGAESVGVNQQQIMMMAQNITVIVERLTDVEKENEELKKRIEALEKKLEGVVFEN